MGGRIWAALYGLAAIGDFASSEFVFHQTFHSRLCCSGNGNQGQLPAFQSDIPVS
jgi:hypothetical protein